MPEDRHATGSRRSANRPARLRGWLAVLLLSAAAAAPGTDLARASAQRHLLAHLGTQQIAGAQLQLLPLEADWSFLAARYPDRIDGQGHALPLPGMPDASTITVAEGAVPAGARLCQRFDDFRLYTHGERCAGEWTANRADPEASGAASFRLGWGGPGVVTEQVDLAWRHELDYQGMLEVPDTVYGRLLFAQNGAGVSAYDESGSLLWSTAGLGLGELIDVADLDGDGTPELVYSPFARLASGGGASSAPGGLVVLDAHSGTVLWRYEFSGLESGISRERTAIASVDGGQTRSIVTVLTYSDRAWRFDFSDGVRNGRLAWTSGQLIYNAPFKRPLVRDLDNDGEAEVVVDTYGRLYVLEGETGQIRTSAAYATNYTFGGFLQPLQRDGATGFLVASNSIYLDGAAYLEYGPDGLTTGWSRIIEENIENHTLNLRLPQSAMLLDGNEYLAWSLDGGGGGGPLQLVSVATGETVAERPGALLIQQLRGDDGHSYLLVQEGATARLLAPHPDGFEVVASWPGLYALPPQNVGRSGREVAEAGAARLGLLVAADKSARGLMVGADGQPVLWNPQLNVAMAVPATLHISVDGDALIVSDGANLHRIRALQAAEPAGHHAAASFDAPLIADLEGDGTREVLVPYGAARGVGRATPGGGLVLQGFGGEILRSNRETTLSPLVLGAPGQARTVVGFERTYRPALTARAPDGQLLWANQGLLFGWEALIAAGRNADGDDFLFYHDSLGTRRLDPATGFDLWSGGHVGQCQRQMVVLDWGGSGVPDVGLQYGDTLSVFDGESGQALESLVAAGSYGGYQALAYRELGGGGRGKTLLAHNSGGLTAIAPGGQVLADGMLEPRLFESIPLVVERAPTGDERVWQISGEGLLRRLHPDGTIAASRDLDEPVLSMSGAFVDADSRLDLLVVTFRGALIAISGADLSELWRLDLGTAAGTPVATDLDGDGQGEILLTSIDGRLLVVRERVSTAFALDAAGMLSTIDVGTLMTLPIAAISGIGADEAPAGLDIRAATAGLYLLTRDLGGTGRLYGIDTATAQATLVATLAADPGDASMPYQQLPPGPLAFDANPLTDRMHILAGDGSHWSVDSDSGLVVSEAALGPLQPAGVAFTGNHAGTAATALLAIDVAQDKLFAVDAGATSEIGPLGVDAQAVAGFDVVTVGTTDIAYVSLVVGGDTGMYSLDLQTGAATLLGDLADGLAGFSVRRPAESNDAGLAALVPAPGILSPAFTPGITEYSLVVPNGTTNLTLAATLAQADATLEIDGMPTASGAPSAPIPVGAGSFVVMVDVTAEDGSTQRHYRVTVTPDPGLAISTPALAGAQRAEPYQATIEATADGAQAPLQFSLAAGHLPAGLVLGSDGQLGGVPMAAGEFDITIRVRDATPATAGGPFSALRSFTLSVARSAQAIIFAPLADRTFGPDPIDLAQAANSDAGLPLAFVSETPAVCDTNANLLTLLSAGECRVVAGQPGNTDFAPAQPVARAFQIAKRVPEIALQSQANPAAPHASVALVASVSGAAPSGSVAFYDGVMPIAGCAEVALEGASSPRTAVCTTQFDAPAQHLVEARYSGDGGHAPGAAQLALSVIEGSDVRLSLMRVAPAAESLAQAQGAMQAEYRLRIDGLGPASVEALRVVSTRLIGLHDPLWTCIDPADLCAPGNGAGALDVAFDLAPQQSVEIAVVGTIDYTRRYVEIVATAHLPDDLPALNPSDDSAALVEPIDAEAIFHTGFE